MSLESPQSHHVWLFDWHFWEESLVINGMRHVFDFVIWVIGKSYMFGGPFG